MAFLQSAISGYRFTRPAWFPCRSARLAKWCGAHAWSLARWHNLGHHDSAALSPNSIKMLEIYGWGSQRIWGFKSIECTLVSKSCLCINISLPKHPEKNNKHHFLKPLPFKVDPAFKAGSEVQEAARMSLDSSHPLAPNVGSHFWPPKSTTMVLVWTTKINSITPADPSSGICASIHGFRKYTVSGQINKDKPLWKCFHEIPFHPASQIDSNRFTMVLFWVPFVPSLKYSSHFIQPFQGWFFSI